MLHVNVYRQIVSMICQELEKKFFCFLFISTIRDFRLKIGKSFEDKSLLGATKRVDICLSLSPSLAWEINHKGKFTFDVFFFSEHLAKCSNVSS